MLVDDALPTLTYGVITSRLLTETTLEQPTDPSKTHFPIDNASGTSFGSGYCFADDACGGIDRPAAGSSSQCTYADGLLFRYLEDEEVHQGHADWNGRRSSMVREGRLCAEYLEKTDEDLYEEGTEECCSGIDC